MDNMYFAKWLALSCLVFVVPLGGTRVDFGSRVNLLEFPPHNVRKGLYNHTLSAIDSLRPLGIIESIRGKLKLHKLAQDIDIYMVVDSNGDPLYSFYPLNQSAGGEAVSIWGTFWARPKPAPPASQITAHFAKLFQDSKSTNTSVSRHSVKRLKPGFPDALLHFMDPNACAAHCENLQGQGKDVVFKKTTLDTFIKSFMNTSRNFEPILLPLPEALVYATSSGATSFRGTPLFASDPPLVKTTPGSKTQEFNPSTDSLALFFSPKQVLEIYRKCWWGDGAHVNIKGNKEYYKIIGNSKPWSPNIHTTSFETLCRKIYTTEPFWAHFIHFVPTNIVLDSCSTQLTQESPGAAGLVARAASYFNSLFKR